MMKRNQDLSGVDLKSLIQPTSNMKAEEKRQQPLKTKDLLKKNNLIFDKMKRMVLAQQQNQYKQAGQREQGEQLQELLLQQQQEQLLQQQQQEQQQQQLQQQEQQEQQLQQQQQQQYQQQQEQEDQKELADEFKDQKTTKQKKQTLNRFSESFFTSIHHDQTDHIWHNTTQSSYKNNIYYKEYLNTSRHVSSNEKLLSFNNQPFNLSGEYYYQRQQSQNYRQSFNQSLTTSFYQTQNTEDTSSQASSYNNISCANHLFNIRQTLYLTSQKQLYFKIHLDKIIYDKRTTLMIKNIPNKYRMAQLLQEVNSYGHEDKYNFFYVPVDFNNDCNKGYAFINFVHQSYIEKFYLDFNNRKWSNYNSEKICQLCYGSFQGLNQLVNLFYQAEIMKDERYKPYIRYDLQIKQSQENMVTQFQKQPFKFNYITPQKR